jgi:two-component system cell cycle sensor histidine kinase/response regulator CckA
VKEMGKVRESDPLEVETILRRSIQILAILVMINSASGVVGGSPPAAQSIYLGILAFLLLGAFALKRGYVKQVGIGLVVTSFTAVSAAVALFGGLRSGNALNSFLVVIVLTGLVWSMRAAVGIAILAALVTFVIGLAQSADVLPTLQPIEDQSLLSLWTGFALNIILTAGILHVAMGRLQRTANIARRSEERLSAVVAGTPDGIVTVDESLCILSANPTARRLAGSGSQEIVGRPFIDSLGIEGEDASGLTRHLSSAMGAAATAARVEMTIGTDRDATPVELILSPFEAEDGSPAVLIMIHDLTERRHAEQERALLMTRLRSSEKMEAVGKLAGGIAHDFNNLLTVIIGHADDLLRTVSRESQHYEPAEIIREAAQRAAALTRQLLTFSRQQPNEPMLFDLNECVHDMERMLTRLIGVDIQLALELDSAVLPILADHAQIEQIIANLIVNARDAMPEGGKIRVETRRESLERADPRAPELKTGDYACLSVSDTGEGIPEGVKERIFEPFFTTKEVGKGTGLGLATVHGIVSQADGDIRVESDPSTGTRFEVLLPLQSGAELVDHTTPEIESPEPRPIDVPESAVLVVEDENAVRKLLVSMLREQGFSVREAVDGEEALEVMEALDGDVAAVLSDVQMPRMSGFELATRLRERWPHTRLLLMSGYPDGAGAAALEGNVKILAKPFNSGELVERVQDLLREDDDESPVRQ